MNMMKVLVPFDIGVVYIINEDISLTMLGFSPLRYWGGLYLNAVIGGFNRVVLVPFDIGVVYINMIYKIR